ncbi:hypothetical protein D3C79_702570 [compost metagenome]
MTAGVDHAADADQVTDLIAADVGADGGDLADDFVAGHQRVDGDAPFVAGLVNVGVAHATVENLDRHIVGTRAAALEGHGRQGRGGRLGGVTDGCVHRASKTVISEGCAFCASSAAPPIVIPPPVMPKTP